MRETPTARMKATRGGRVARLADGRHVMAPTVATFTTTQPSADFPAIEITADVNDAGSIVVTAARLIATIEQPLTADAVRAWSLPKLAEQAMSVATFDPNPDTTGSTPAEPVAVETVVRAVRKRETVTTDRLAEVAHFYELGGVAGIEAVLYVSRGQAYRLVKQAREAGLLPLSH